MGRGEVQGLGQIRVGKMEGQSADRFGGSRSQGVNFDLTVNKPVKWNGPYLERVTVTSPDTQPAACLVQNPGPAPDQPSDLLQVPSAHWTWVSSASRRAGWWPLPHGAVTRNG